MPTVEYQNSKVKCENGENLKEVIEDSGMSPHKGVTKRVNCGGHATCGTCAIRLTEGPTKEREDVEKTRLRVATHDDKEEVRLACQYTVTEDIIIEQP